MTVAIRPPEYFPRLAYMALVQHVDHFILADTFPYRRQSFQDRSKLRNAEGWHWIKVPIFGRRDGAPLQAVEIDTKGRWREKHWRSFLYDYRSTMYFEYYEASFRPFFEQRWSHLAACTGRSVELLAELFGIQTTVHRASAMNNPPSSLVGLAECTDADVLVVPEGEDPDDASIQVQTMTYDHPTYRQNFQGFEPGMTAADLLFNYGREAVRMLAGGGEVSSRSPSSP